MTNDLDRLSATLERIRLDALIAEAEHRLTGREEDRVDAAGGAESRTHHGSQAGGKGMNKYTPRDNKHGHTGPRAEPRPCRKQPVRQTRARRKALRKVGEL